MSSSKRSCRHFTTEQKVAILKRHMVDKVQVSDLCNEENLQPSVFYQWAPRNFKAGSPLVALEPAAGVGGHGGVAERALATALVIDRCLVNPSP
jgi:transposase-like protein